MNYEEILQTVRGFCAREKLLDGKKHLALAVSGGADSMALLCLMRPLAEEKGIPHGLPRQPRPAGGDGGPGRSLRPGGLRPAGPAAAGVPCR